MNTNKELWNKSKKKASCGPPVLIPTAIGGLSALSLIESLLAVALTLRGARVHTLLCDWAMPVCFRVENPTLPDTEIFEKYNFNRHILCRDCFETGHYIYEPLGLRQYKFSRLLDKKDIAEARKIAHQLSFSDIKKYYIADKSIGEHAYAGALRYFASGNLDNEPDGEMLVRRYFEGALLSAWVMERLLKKHNFISACFNHGIYCPQGIIGEVCRSQGVRVINWNVAYRKRCFIFSHKDTYHHTMLSEPVSVWENLPWDSAMEKDIMEYLKSRWSGSKDWIWFHEKPEEDIKEIARETGIDFSKPVIGMLTNVMWDAQLHYRANAFPDILTWAVETIKYFARRPDLQLLIRIHPAEIRGGMPSRQLILPEILKVISKLPENVFIIPPDSQISTYAAMLKCDTVIIYGTKTGVELTSMGIPVVVGGEAWIRSKGLTIDATSPSEYFSRLDKLPLGIRLSSEVTTRARKYAYHFFFRRMVPFCCIEPSEGWPPYKVSISKLDELMPGVDPGLDAVCDGILSGSPFVYEAEKLGLI